MTALATLNPIPQYFELDGSPLDGGRLYFGLVNQSPESNPVTVYWDAAATQPAAQPIATMNGYPVRFGTPAMVYATSDYSLMVRDKKGRQVFYGPNSADFGNASSIFGALNTFIATMMAYIASVASSIGSSLVGFIQAAAGAISRTVQSKLREELSLFDFMSDAEKADVIAGTMTLDVTASVQKAIDFVCGQTSVTVGSKGGKLFAPPGRYLLTDTLHVGYGLVLEGIWAGGYPYVSTTSQTTEFHFDFGANVNRWAIDSQTFHSAADGGGRILYNEWVTDKINGTGTGGFTPTYGMSIKGILMVDDNYAAQTQVIYGALRLNGCPNARIENVSMLGFGYAMAFGSSYGTSVKNCTSQTNYYGAVAYNANNGIAFVGCQFDKIVSPASIAVPVGAIPNWMPSAANFASVYYLDGSHNAAAKGVIIAGDPAIGSNGSIIEAICQYWPDAYFLLNSYANVFTKLYAEQCSGHVLTTAYAGFNVVDGHSFSQAPAVPTPPYFADFGYNSLGRVNITGSNVRTAFWHNAFASADPADLTRVVVLGISNGGGMLPANRRVMVEYEEGSWTPVITPSGGAITSVTGVSGFYTKQLNEVRLEFAFTIANNGTGSGTLQVDGLPYASRNAEIEPVLLNGAIGQAVCTPGSTRIQLFTAAGAYPGASGVSYRGVVTYLV